MDNRNLLPLLLSISLSGLTSSAYSGNPNPSTPPILGISADQTTAISNGNRLFVDNQIGKSSCTDYTPESRSCSGGSDTAYNSFGGASRAAHAGDTVYVREGRFKEQLKVRNSGT
ncbi:hypothetical protein Ga0076813_16122, partial [endosymbiont of Ridgeia piscesae]